MYYCNVKSTPLSGYQATGMHTYIGLKYRSTNKQIRNHFASFHWCISVRMSKTMIQCTGAIQLRPGWDILYGKRDNSSHFEGLPNRSTIRAPRAKRFYRIGSEVN